MALSNIFREPRREITESVVGIAAAAIAVGIVAPGDYYFALWFEEITGGHKTGGCPWELGMAFFGPCAGLLILGAILATHGLGDAICNRLERVGLQLRPRNRP